MPAHSAVTWSFIPIFCRLWLPVRQRECIFVDFLSGSIVFVFLFCTAQTSLFFPANMGGIFFFFVAA